MLSLIATGCGGQSGGTATNTATATAAATARPHSAWARAKLGMRRAFPHRVTRMDRQHDTSVLVTLKGADNLTNGMIRTGLKLDAGTALKVFHDAGYKPKDIIVLFDMPVMTKATGQESIGTVAQFEITRGEMRNINWTNVDVIDWNAYRTMLAPFLQ